MIIFFGIVFAIYLLPVMLLLANNSELKFAVTWPIWASFFALILLWGRK